MILDPIDPSSNYQNQNNDIVADTDDPPTQDIKDAQASLDDIMQKLKDLADELKTLLEELGKGKITYQDFMDSFFSKVAITFAVYTVGCSEAKQSLNAADNKMAEWMGKKVNNVADKFSKSGSCNADLASWTSSVDLTDDRGVTLPKGTSLDFKNIDSDGRVAFKAKDGSTQYFDLAGDPALFAKWAEEGKVPFFSPDQIPGLSFDPSSKMGADASGTHSTIIVTGSPPQAVKLGQNLMDARCIYTKNLTDFINNTVADFAKIDPNEYPYKDNPTLFSTLTSNMYALVANNKDGGQNPDIVSMQEAADSKFVVANPGDGSVADKFNTDSVFKDDFKSKTDAINTLNGSINQLNQVLQVLIQQVSDLEKTYESMGMKNWQNFTKISESEIQRASS